jgi:regulator of replication initiation timing
MHIVNAPVDYYPTDNGNEFYDDVSKYSCTLFKQTGVKCACGSHAIHNNRYSFQHQHCKTKKHREFLQKLSENRPSIIKQSIEREAEIKELRLSNKRQEHKIIQLERKIRELEHLCEENVELRAENEQMREHIQSETKKIAATENTNKKLEMEIKKTEVFAMAFLATRGYDFCE